MTGFVYQMPTKIISGRDCLTGRGELLRPLGKKALIVTGRSSSGNGSLSDAVTALRNNGQEFSVFDGVRPNPTLDCVQAAQELYKGKLTTNPEGHSGEGIFFVESM